MPLLDRRRMLRATAGVFGAEASAGALPPPLVRLAISDELGSGR
jgi:hypothetical protein